jgi:hypothetical protein
MNTILGPTDEQVDTMRHNIMSRITPEIPTPRARTATPAPRRRRVAFTAVGVAAAAALVVGSVLIPSGDDSSAEAATALNSAANLTVTMTDPVAGPGQYLRIETLASYGIVVENTAGDKVSYLAPQSTVIYQPNDTAVEWVMERQQLVPTVFYGEGAKAAAMQDWEISKSDTLTNGIFRAKDAAFYGSPGEPARSTEDLPRDPAELYNHIRAEYTGGSNSADEAAWVWITDLLHTGTVPSDLRSALYSAAAMIPGIELVPGTTTINGRNGIAIGRIESSRDERQDIIIDEKTGALLGERSVRTKDGFGAPAGTTWAITSVTTTVVDSAP